MHRRGAVAYGSSKLMTEIMLHDVASAHGMNYVVLRYFNVAGADRWAHWTCERRRDASLKIAVEALSAARQGRRVRNRYPTPTEAASGISFTSAIWRRRIAPALSYLRGGGTRNVELRLWPRLLRARNHRGGAARLRGVILSFNMPAKAARYHDHDCRYQPHPHNSGLDAAIRMISRPSPHALHGSGNCSATPCRARARRVGLKSRSVQALIWLEKP